MTSIIRTSRSFLSICAPCSSSKRMLQFLAKCEKICKAQSEEQDFNELIPGLIYQPDFLTENTMRYLYTQTLQLHDKICTSRTGAPVQESEEHNLPFKKYYKYLYFEDTPGRNVTARSFVNYGSPGHELTYFVCNQNVPSFIHEELIIRISQTAPVQTLASQVKTSLKWRFTFNVYKNQGLKQAGFDWHKDLTTNGKITSIATIFGKATFQLRPEGNVNPSTTYSLSLTPGSILLLSGDSRWKWEHRVVMQDASAISSIGRISLVLGCA